MNLHRRIEKKKALRDTYSKVKLKAKKRSAEMFMLLAILVLFLHAMGYLWLRQSIALPEQHAMRVPFKLEVNLIGKNGLKASLAPPSAQSQPKSGPKPKPKQNQNAKKISPAKEKLPDVVDILQLMKSRPAKVVSKKR